MMEWSKLSNQKQGERFHSKLVFISLPYIAVGTPSRIAPTRNPRHVPTINSHQISIFLRFCVFFLLSKKLRGNRFVYRRRRRFMGAIMFIVRIIMMRQQTDKYRRQEHENKRLQKGDEQFQERDGHSRKTADEGNARHPAE